MIKYNILASSLGFSSILTTFINFGIPSSSVNSLCLLSQVKTSLFDHAKVFPMEYMYDADDVGFDADPFPLSHHFGVFSCQGRTMD